MMNSSQTNPALAAATRLLAAKRLSKAQLAQKLRDRGYPPDDVDESIAECDRLGYVDDRTFAQLYVKSVLDRKAVGRMRLLQDLLRQGIDGDLAREAIDEFTGDDVDRIDRALAKLEELKAEADFAARQRQIHETLAQGSPDAEAAALQMERDEEAEVQARLAAVQDDQVIEVEPNAGESKEAEKKFRAQTARRAAAKEATAETSMVQPTAIESQVATDKYRDETVVPDESHQDNPETEGGTADTNKTENS